MPTASAVPLRSRRGAILMAVSLAGVVGAAPASGQEHGHDDLGRVEFPVSCGEAARARLERGVALLHHMMYEQARGEFEAVAAAEPGCGMAAWGVAMTLFQPLWPGGDPDEAELARGRELLARARRAVPETGRERLYLEALEAFYAEGHEDYASRLRAWEAGQRRVHEAYPGDDDAAAFYALARLATAPPTDETLAQQREAAEVLARVLERNPRHPGALHYTIHAHDHVGLAEGGREAAAGYDRIAPSVPHALHMPTHIFVRVGAWGDVIRWNRRSAEAALRFPVGDLVSMHWPHALDYLAYAHLQRGEDAKARAVLEEMLAVERVQPSYATLYAYAAVPARYAVERGAWAEAAALEPRRPAALPWDRMHGTEALTHFARGLGAARSGDAAGARRAAARLEALAAEARRAGNAYWAEQIEIQRTAVAAWAAQAEGRGGEARRLLREAAEREAAAAKSPVTPGPIVPGYELLGDLLLAQGDAPGALRAYEAALSEAPGRLNAHVGAMRAAERAGEAAAARRHRAAILELLRDAEPDRPAIVRLRAAEEAGS